jgi:hypothetical protein
MLAGAIGRRAWIRPLRHDPWVVNPNLWGAIIGRSGVMKSPVLRAALRPLRRRQVVEQPSHALLQFRAHSRFSAVARHCSLGKFIQSCRLGFVSSCDNHDLIVSTERAPQSPS